MSAPTLRIATKAALALALLAALFLATSSADADTYKQLATLTASDGDPGDGLGYAVALDGDVTLAGAPRDAAGGDDAGAAYVYERDAGGPDAWGEVKKLLAGDSAGGAHFGVSVAASGDAVLVGAHYADTGAAYVFQRDQGGPDNWGQVAKLTASDGQTFDIFGISVALDGDTAAVGGMGVDGFTGAVYVFERDEGGPDNWGEVAKVVPSDVTSNDYFGTSVALDGDTLVAGARQNSAAYVFGRDEGGPDSWGEVAKLTGSSAGPNDLFGDSVGLSGDTAIVGAPNEDAGGVDAGAAYLFERNAGGADNWGEVKRLVAPDAAIDDGFGSVAISADVAVVGSPFGNGNAANSGAAFVFGRDQGGPDNWGLLRRLSATNGAAGDEFGRSVAVDAIRVLAGAPEDDGASANSGAAYVFSLDQPKATPTPSSVGGVALDSSAPLQPAGQPASSERESSVVAWGIVAGAMAAMTGAAWLTLRRFVRQ